MCVRVVCVLPVEAVDHLELAAQVLLREVVEHARVDEALHEGGAVLRQPEARQPLVADPLVVHLAERQRLQQEIKISVCYNTELSNTTDTFLP